MFIYYRGYGFWSPFILFASYVLVRGIHEDGFDINGWRWWSAATGCLLGGAIVVWWGRRMNGPLDQLLENSEPDSAPSARHSMYGVRMEYWGASFFMLGLVFAMMSFAVALMELKADTN
jgi:hypothetical protein